jgi:RHS repeat-associated protein
MHSKLPLLKAFAVFGLLVALNAQFSLSLGKYTGAITQGRDCSTPKETPVKQSAISLTDRNLLESCLISTVENTQGATLSLSLAYNSFHADGECSQVDTVAGYGWTHSYNDFLFFQRGHALRWDGEGRIAIFRLGPGGSYTADRGHFDTLIRNPDGSHLLTKKDQTAYRFAFVSGSPFLVEGPVQRLQSITDRNGNTTSLIYAGGDLVQVTDAWGRSLRLTYSPSHKLLQVVDPLGRTNSFTYDASGRRLATITDAAGKTTRFLYNFYNQLVQKTDRGGRSFFYGYRNGSPVEMRDGAQVLRVSLANPVNWATDPDALAYTLTRVYIPSVTTLTDGFGGRWEYAYDTNGFMVSARMPDGTTNAWSYDPITLRLASARDGLGRTTRHFYDALGNRLRTIDPLNNTNVWTYDPVFNQRTSHTDQNGRVTTWRYDERGNRTNEIGPAPFFYTRSWTYDSHGNVLTEKDPNGNLTRHFYDHYGNRTNTIDALNNVTRFTYDAVGNLLSRTDANNHTTTYAYDALNRIISETTGLTGPAPSPLREANLNLELQTLADGSIQILWQQPGAILTHATSLAGPFEDVCVGGLSAATSPFAVTGSRTNAAEFYRLRADPAVLAALGYEAPGAGTGTGKSGGQIGSGGGRQPKDDPPAGPSTTTYAYDAEGHRTAVTNCNGAVTRHGYDLRKRLVRTTDALGSTVGYAYHNNDNQISVTNQNGFATHYAYDARNRLVATTDALGNTSTRCYDAVGNLLSETDCNGHATSYAYDALNRRIAKTDALGGTTLFEYALAGGASCCSPATGSSLLTKQTDANGHVTYFKYDALDRRTQTIRKQGDTADLIDSDDAVTACTYDPNGNRLTEATRISATEYLTNWFGYDALNRPVASTNGAGDFTLTSYDPVGNMRVVQAPNLNLTTNTYDAQDRLIQVDDRIGRVASYTYDCVGNRLSQTDGNTNTTAYAYDALSRLITTTDAMHQPTRYFYDPVGNLLKVTDRMSNSTSYDYDPLSRRVAETKALGFVTGYGYDCLGNLLSITDARTNTTSCVYDALYRKLLEVYPDTPATNEPPDSNKRFFAYDGVGNVTNRLDQKSNLTVYAYSDLYLLTNRSYVSDPADRFTYDLAGRMLTASKTNWLTTNDWVVTFAYDGANRVTNTTQGGRVIAYAFDIPGRTRSLTYPSGTNITEQFDARNRLLAISDGSLPPIATYTYDLGNRVLTRTYRNGVVAEYAYNPNNWITSLIHTNPAASNLIAGFTYAYDREGNKLYEENLWNTNRSEAYAYDPIYRLTRWLAGALVGDTIPAPTNTQAWQLDCLGNWLTTITNGMPEYRTHNAANEITSTQYDDGPVAPVYYDYNGNLNNNSRHVFVYDEMNRMVTVSRTTDASLLARYAYDAFGRRVMKAATPAGAPSDICFLYCAARWRLIEEQNSSGFPEAVYVYGRGLRNPITMQRKELVYHYHDRALPARAAVTNSRVDPVERYTYNAYGAVDITDGEGMQIPPTVYGTAHSAIGNPRLFTMGHLDEETGLYYYGYRYYAPDWGIWTTRDPLLQNARRLRGADYTSVPGLLWGRFPLNSYEYGYSNPTRFIDLVGLQGVVPEDVENTAEALEGAGLLNKAGVWLKKVMTAAAGGDVDPAPEPSEEYGEVTGAGAGNVGASVPFWERLKVIIRGDASTLGPRGPTTKSLPYRATLRRWKSC